MSDSVKEPPPGGSTDPGNRPEVQSLKTNRSRTPPPEFNEPGPETRQRHHLSLFRNRPEVQSLKTNRSRTPPPEFNEPGPETREESAEGPGGDCELDSVFQRLEEQVVAFVQQQLKRLHGLLASDYPECSESEGEELSREAVFNIAVDFLKRMDQEHLAQRLQTSQYPKVLREVKSSLVQKFSRVCEGIARQGNSSELNQIYTELYITEGESTEQHEARYIETTARKPATAETAIKCEDMFKLPPHRPIRGELTRQEPMTTESQGPIRIVLTKGVAGVGKTVLTQKFSLDWAEGRAHQDLQLLFLFTFRELNVLKNTRFSLMGLLHHFFSPSKGLCSLQQLQVLFIFDGLDECRLPLDFSRTRVLTDPTESTSVHVLLVNLIRGRLLPSARLWITTRPAAANQIPAECVSMVTEVRGFADPQKEQYFRKRFRDQATTIISHIKSIRSLHIMCSIPIFCWILSTVLQKLLEQTERPELPRTLTQMYVHFLVVQAKVKNIKYHQGSGADLHWTPETREMVESLGKVAFDQLQKGNLIFYESDLSKCGLDAAAASKYSGVFTQVFREEPGLYQDKVYCFIHLSVQEFMAALHVHQTFFSSRRNLLKPPQSSEKPKSERAFYRSAVDQALQSPNGHLDLFLRFLLGLSLPTNQRLLQGLLTHTGSERTNQETVKYIKQKLNEEGVSVERSLNLFHCLNELNDHSLVEEIQKNFREGRLKADRLSPAQWSALCFLLLSSDSHLEEFDLRKYCPSEKALLNLLPVIKISTKAILSCCNLTELSCGPLASVFSSSSLTHLDLSDNDLRDSGVELLCDGLKSALCRLETLRLSGCLVSEMGGAALASALSSAPSHLRELDLSYNHPGPSAELLTALRDQRPLLSVRLDPSGERWMVPGPRKYYCELTLDLNTVHREVTVSEDKRTMDLSLFSPPPPPPDHEDRFTGWWQVLGSSSLRGRCYWEVWCRGNVDIAVSYRGIRRKGDGEECGFGHNDQSWTMRIERGQYSFLHNERKKPDMYSFVLEAARKTVNLFVAPTLTLPSTVGVFLDTEAGTLSFFKVLYDGRLSHLHTFSASFTEPVFLGFGVRWNSSVSLLSMRRT